MLSPTPRGSKPMRSKRSASLFVKNGLPSAWPWIIGWLGLPGPPASNTRLPTRRSGLPAWRRFTAMVIFSPSGSSQSSGTFICPHSRVLGASPGQACQLRVVPAAATASFSCAPAASVIGFGVVSSDVRSPRTYGPPLFVGFAAGERHQD